jgi:hypothetical protein
MAKNLIKELGVGLALVGALAGTAYAGTKEDLDAVREYVMKHPTVVSEVSINNSPRFKSYELKKGDSVVETNKYGTLFERVISGNRIYMCDNENDGDLNRIVILRGTGASKSDEEFAKLECFTDNSLDGEVEMSDMFQTKGKTPYDSRAVIDVDKEVVWDFDDGQKKGLSKAKELAEKFYQGALRNFQNLTK